MESSIVTSVVGTLANENLILSLIPHDPAAFALVYDHYFAAVYNYVRYRIHDAQQSEDVTAQIFERVLSRFERYDSQQASFAVWLFTIARNLVTDHLRTQQRRRWFPFDLLGEQPQTTPLPEEQVLHNERQAALLQALQCLTDRERDLLALKFVAQMTNRRIAELTELSESNVAVILHRALSKLRTELREEDV